MTKNATMDFPESWLARMSAKTDAELEAGFYDNLDVVEYDTAKAHPAVSYWELGCEDCLVGMKRLPSNSIKAIVTDPPYGMKIDNKPWDEEVPGVPIWREALRVLESGGIAIAASHAKTYHQLATMMELAGFEIVDMLFWTYGSSFPAGGKMDDEWRTLLKRSHEPWVVARKPIAAVEVPGKRPGTTKKRTPGLRENFEANGGAGGFRVVGNGQGEHKWAANFIQAKKPKKKERSLGLDETVIRKGIDQGATGKSVADQPNNHSTVKPLGLMRRIVRLVAGEGDYVMDPFSGSGTTGMACMAEGVNFVGFEMGEESFEIFRKRVEFAHANPDKIPKAD